jgi:hypothetical protein
VDKYEPIISALGMTPLPVQRGSKEMRAPYRAKFSFRLSREMRNDLLGLAHDARVCPSELVRRLIQEASTARASELGPVMTRRDQRSRSPVLFPRVQ